MPNTLRGHCSNRNTHIRMQNIMCTIATGSTTAPACSGLRREQLSSARHGRCLSEPPTTSGQDLRDPRLREESPELENNVAEDGSLVYGHGLGFTSLGWDLRHGQGLVLVLLSLRFQRRKVPTQPTLGSTGPPRIRAHESLLACSDVRSGSHVTSHLLHFATPPPHRATQPVPHWPQLVSRSQECFVPWPTWRRAMTRKAWRPLACEGR